MENNRHISETGQPGTGGRTESAALAGLRHDFRNQLQTIISLVGLFGDRMEAGPARAAFLDLRARLEAASITNGDEFASGGQVRWEAMIGALALRIAALYGSAERLTLDIHAASSPIEAKRAATIAQLFAEMLIESFRSETQAADGAVVVAVRGGENGAVSLRISRQSQAATLDDDLSALGRVILDSLAQNLGGAVSRDLSNGFAIGVDAHAPAA